MVTGKAPTAPKRTQNVTNKPAASSAIQEKPDGAKQNIGGYAKDDPPDVEKLGLSSWSLLHSIAANYPESPSNKHQSDLKQFLKLFGNFYPCWYCGEDFEKYMAKNEPKTGTQDDFGKWLCEAHNDVNAKLGKPQFDCNLWKKRWRDGWDE